MTFRMGFGHEQEDQFWYDTLRNLAARFGSHDQQPTLERVCVDERVQWSEAGNLWQSAAIRSIIYTPVHFTKRLFRRT